MKTIAITIDLKTLLKVQQLEEAEGRNRSEIVREAVQEYIADRERELEEEKERRVYHRLRERLNRQAAVLVKEQARP